MRIKSVKQEFDARMTKLNFKTLDLNSPPKTFECRK